MLLMTGLIAGLPASAGKVDRGVSVGGYDVSGKTRDQAIADLQSRFDAYMTVPLTLRVGEASVELLPSELGITFDAAATYNRALLVGRGSFFEAGAERVAAHTRGIDVEPVVAFDPEQLAAELESLGGAQIVAPVDASFTFQRSELAVQSSAAGAGIDASAAALALHERLNDLSHAPVVAPVVTIAPNVTTQDLEEVGSAAVALLDEPLIVTDGIQNWQITPDAVASVLTARDGELSVNTLALSAIVGTISSSINREAVPAGIVSGGDGSFAMQPEVASRELDVPASVAAIERQLLRGDQQIALVTTETTPNVTAAYLQPLLNRANELSSRGMTVTWSEGEQALDRAAFASTFLLDPQTLSISFDQAKLFALLEPIAQSINRPPSGFRWKDWSIVAPEGALPGRLVDINASIGTITANALAGTPNAALAIQQESDPVKSASGIVIRDLLGTASTFYGSSSYNRATNVELAISSLDGALVEPGGTFSFNNAIGGTTTLEDGYMMGFGIMTDENGAPTTVPSVAGGICQVATNVFQAAFWAGMPIGTRSWHLYWIPNYGTGPGGMMGLDATVDSDYGLDFTFQNPTSDWLAINAVADGEWITVEVWGTNQGWQVQADEPIIENVVKADQKMYREQSSELPRGEEVVVEYAQDGFTATIRRVVQNANGEVIDDWSMTSYYLPARNVTLVGTGGDQVVEEEVVEEPAVEEPIDEEPVVEEPVVEEPVIEEPTPEPIEEPTAEPTEELVIEEPVEEATPEPTE